MKKTVSRWMVASTVLLLAGKTLAASGDDLLVQKYKDAQAEGQTQVVIYTPYGNLQPVWDAFAKAYPSISVRTAVIPGGGAPLLARVRAEATSGNHTGDLVITGLGDINTLLQENRLEADTPPQAATLPAQYKDPQGYYQIPFNTLFTLVYNSNLIKKEQLPQSFDEAIGSQWQGKFGFARFTGAASSDLVGTVLSVNQAISDQQLNQIKQHGREAPTAATLLTNVAQGRLAYGLWVPTQGVRSLQQDGAPLQIYLLKDSAVLMGPGISLLNKAPDKAAAQLLKAWLLSATGQKALIELASSYGTQPGSPVPPGLPDISDYHFKNVALNNYESALKDFRIRTQAVWGQ